MNPVGVAFVQLDHDLSMSNARIRNAPPKILTKTAKISAVYRTTVPIAPINYRIPGTPKKNFEYVLSYIAVFKNFPNTA